MDNIIYYSLKDRVTAESGRVPLSSICRLLGADEAELAKAFIEGRPPAFAVTAFEVSEKLDLLFPGSALINAGPPEVLVTVEEKKQSKIWLYAKTAFLCLVMFTGGAFAIVTFHEDVGMRIIQSGIYRFFTGSDPASPLIIGIPYSIGIALGFALLLGLFGGRRNRPTNLDLDISARQKALKDYLAGKRR